MYNYMVSIITPVYNSDSTLEATIKSVLKQVFTDWELILVDDSSEDNSVEIIKKFLILDSRIKYIPISNQKGAAYARNMAIKKATGRLIAFLDSDDLWNTMKLSKQVEFMLRNNYSLTFTYYQKFKNNIETGLRGIIEAPESINYFDMLKTCYIGCLTAIYDSKLLGKVYLPDIEKRQDYGLWLKILKLTDRAHSYPAVLAYYRVSSNSLSSNKITSSKFHWKILREIEKQTLISSIYYFMHYAYNGVKKFRK